MKLIPLSQGQSAQVDDADFDWLSQWKWTAQRTAHGFYATRYDGDRLVLMHRLINGTPEGMVTDHRDCNGLNNQRSNLRTATQLQNMMNRRGKRGGTSRFKGVWADPNPRNLKLWRSAIRINGKLKYLGRFHNEEDAAAAYAAAARQHFGEFARDTPGERP
jgi:hypothetical protein